MRKLAVIPLILLGVGCSKEKELDCLYQKEAIAEKYENFIEQASGDLRQQQLLINQMKKELEKACD